MGIKTIALSEEIYNKLRKKKRSGESFSDLISRMLNDEEKRKENPITDYFGTLDDNDEEWDRIEKEIYEDRFNLPEREENTF